MVWAAGLTIRYGFHQPQYGERWTTYSWLQLGGFVLLVTGTAVYNSLLHIPGMRRAEGATEEDPLRRARSDGSKLATGIQYGSVAVPTDS